MFRGKLQLTNKQFGKNCVHMHTSMHKERDKDEGKKGKRDKANVVQC